MQDISAEIFITVNSQAERELSKCKRYSAVSCVEILSHPPDKTLPPQGYDAVYPALRYNPMELHKRIRSSAKTGHSNVCQIDAEPFSAALLALHLITGSNCIKC